MPINAPTPILNLPVATGVDGTYWVPTASTNGSPTERVNVVTLSGLQGSLDSISKTQGAILYRGASQWTALDPGTAGFVLATGGPNADPAWQSASAGSVSSVGLALPLSLFSISGSPVTSTGTLTGSLIVQNANKVFAGPTTGADATPTFRGLVNADISPIGAALTKTDDTNVTLSLGGSPTTALVNAASLTLGWTGQLSVPRGGTGQPTLAAHGVLLGAGTSGVNVTGTGTADQVLTSNGASADPTFQDATAALGKALTIGNDTNVTLTLGGSPTTALLSASSITAGWTGLLGLARGGTNANLSATGGTSQVLRQSSTGAAVTVSQLTAADIGGGQALTRTNDTNVTLTLGGTPTTSLLAATSLTLGWTGTLAVARGGIGVGTLTSHGVLLGQGTGAVTATSVGATGSVLAGNTSSDPTFQGISAIIDNLGSTQGNILYRNGTVWTVLAPGTSGQVLQSGGAAANPSWTTISGTGTVTSVSGSGGTTGLTLTGGPITTSGTLTLGGTLAASNGGTGLTSLGTGVATWLGTPSSANLAAAVTGETGSGALVFGTSPTLGGTPLAPTAAVDTNTTQIATTAMVLGQAASATPLGNNPTAVVGTSTRYARADHVHPGREVLTSARTYFVATTGSDSNNGLSSGSPFLTLQKAYSTILMLDLNGFLATITVADGTYTAGLNCSSSPIGGNVAMRGNATTPGNCIISESSTSAIQATCPLNLAVSGFQVQTSASASQGVYASGGGANITIDGLMAFGACTQSHIRAAQNGFINITTTAYSISGDASFHFAGAQAGVIATAGTTITLSGSRAITTFAFASSTGVLNIFTTTITGTNTGTRYSATLNGVINVFGAGTSFFPGTIAGTTATGGQYA